ncbi:MAG TPA: zinc ribbon domain-containing protein [Candidatus Limnocylindrales bacterium]|nr:zinc ribbon domain-containing protein [Candidatus Limnocylindrales bacterium]
MEFFSDALGEAVGTILGGPVAGLIIRLIGAYLVLIWLASALWAFLDTRRRSGSLVASYGSAALVILATPLLFPAALLVHVVLRPDGLAADRRLDRLRHLAFAIEAEPRCATCGLTIQEDWLICPGCRHQLSHRCQDCGGTVRLEWSVCAWCAAELDGARDGGTWRKRAGA